MSRYAEEVETPTKTFISQGSKPREHVGHAGHAGHAGLAGNCTPCSYCHHVPQMPSVGIVYGMSRWASEEYCAFGEENDLGMDTGRG